jgi:cyanophycinase
MKYIVVLLSILFTTIWLPRPNMPINEPKKGALVLAGGGHLPENIYDTFINLAGGSRAKIVIIPSAAATEPIIISPWHGHPITILHARNQLDTRNPQFSTILSQATGIWFMGGDQLRLINLYKNTPIEKELFKLLSRGGVIGGTSAGASAVSDIMIYKDIEKIGFGLTHFIIDQHFNSRQRLHRLQNIIHQHFNMTGIGIDEETAVVIKDNKIEIIGNGFVTVCNKNTAKKYKMGEKINIKATLLP